MFLMPSSTSTTSSISRHALRTYLVSSAARNAPHIPPSPSLLNPTSLGGCNSLHRLPAFSCATAHSTPFSSTSSSSSSSSPHTHASVFNFSLAARCTNRLRSSSSPSLSFSPVSTFSRPPHRTRSRLSRPIPRRTPHYIHEPYHQFPPFTNIVEASLHRPAPHQPYLWPDYERRTNSLDKDVVCLDGTSSCGGVFGLSRKTRRRKLRRPTTVRWRPSRRTSGPFRRKRHSIRLSFRRQSFARSSFSAIRAFSTTNLSTSGDDLAWAQQILADMESKRWIPTSGTVNKLIAVFGRAKRLKDVQRTLASALALQVAPDIATYTSLIDIYAKSHRPDLCERLFEDMLTANIEPNQNTYAVMLRMYAKERREAKFDALVNAVWSSQNKPDVVLYTVILNGFGIFGRFDKLDDCLERMVRDGIEPNIITVNTLINAYGRHKRLDVVEKLVSEMHENGLAPDQVTFNSLLNIYGEAGKLDEIELLLQEMRNSGYIPNSRTLVAGMKLFVRHQGFMAVEELLFDCWKAAPTPDVAVFDCFVDAYIINSRVDRARACFDHLLSCRVIPPLPTVHSFVRALRDLSMIDELRDFVSSARHGLGLLKAKAVQEHLAFLGSFQNRVDALTDVSKLRSSIQSMVESSDLKGVEGLWNESGRRQRRELDPLVYNALLGVNAKLGRAGEALGTWRAMRQRGIEIDVLTMRLAMYTCCYAQRLPFEFLDDIAQFARSFVAKADEDTNSTPNDAFAFAMSPDNAARHRLIRQYASRRTPGQLDDLFDVFHLIGWRLSAEDICVLLDLYSSSADQDWALERTEFLLNLIQKKRTISVDQLAIERIVQIYSRSGRLAQLASWLPRDSEQKHQHPLLSTYQLAGFSAVISEPFGLHPDSKIFVYGNGFRPHLISHVGCRPRLPFRETVSQNPCVALVLPFSDRQHDTSTIGFPSPHSTPLPSTSLLSRALVPHRIYEKAQVFSRTQLLVHLVGIRERPVALDAFRCLIASNGVGKQAFEFFLQDALHRKSRSRAQALLFRMLDLGLMPNHRLLRLVLESGVLDGGAVQLREWLLNARGHGAAISEDVFHTLARHLLYDGYYGSFDSFLTDMESFGVSGMLDPKFWSMVVSYYVQIIDGTTLSRILSQIPQLPPLLSDTALTGLVLANIRSGMLGQAERLIHHLRMTNRELHPVVFLELANAYVASRYMDKLMGLSDTMKDFGLQPNFTFTERIESALRQAGRLKEEFVTTKIEEPTEFIGGNQLQRPSSIRTTGHSSY